MRRTSRLARWTLSALLFAACLGTGAAVLIRTAWFHDWLRRAVIARTVQWADGDLTIGSLSGDVLRGVTLHDVAVRRAGAPVLSVNAVSITYDIVGLVRGRLALDVVQLVEPSVTVVETGGGWSIDGIRNAGTAGGQRDVALPHVAVENATLVVREGGRDRRFTGLAGRGALSVTKSGVDVAVQDLTGRDETAGVDIRQFSAAATFSPRTITVSDLSLQSAASDLRGRGSYDRAAQALDAEVVAHPLSLPELARYVPAAAGPSLQPTMELHASGDLRNLQISVNGQSTAGSVRADFSADVESPAKTASGLVMVRDLDLAPILGRRDLAGRITGHGTLRVAVPPDASRTSVAFDLTLPQVAVGTSRASSLRTMGTLQGRVLRAAVRADAYGAHADVRGELVGLGRHETARYTLAGTISGLHLTQLGRSLDIRALSDPRLAGTLNARLDIAGRGRSLEQQQARATITLERSSLAGVSLPHAVITANLADRRLSASVAGTFARLDPQALGLAPSAGNEAAGSIAATVTIPDVRGPVDATTLEGDGTVTLAPSQLAGFAIDRGTIDGALAHGVVTIRQFDLSGPTGAVQVAGQLALGDRDESNLRYVIDVADLAAIGAATGHPMSGRAHSEGTLTGPRARAAVTGNLSAQQLSVGDTLVALAAGADFTATLPDWRLTGATGTADAHATFVTLHGSDFQRIGVTATYDAEGLTFKSELDRPKQQITVDAVMLPRLESHEIELRRLIVGDTHTSWTLSEPRVVLTYSPDRLSVTPATFTHGPERIGIRGTLSLEGSSTDGSALDVSLDRIQLADLGTLVLGQTQPQRPTAIGGELDATLRITGTVSSPDVTSHAVVTGGSVSGVPFDKLSADLNLRGGRIGVTLDLQQSATARLTATGSAPADRHADGVDVDVRSDAIDVRLFQPLTSHLGLASGTVQFDAHVGGSLAAPVVRGTLGAADVGFSVVPTGMTYQHLNARIRFDSDAAHIEQLTVQDDDRHVLTAQGDIQGWLGSDQSIGVKVTAGAFHLLRNDLGELGLDVALDISGSVQHPDVKGTLRTHTARLNLDAWREQFAGGPETVTPEPGTGSIYDQSTWHLTLDLPDNVVVQGKPSGPAASAVSLGGLNTTLGGTLTIAKASEADPTVTGRLQVARGTYQFQGRSFQIANDSEIRFQGRQPIDPDLAITAARDMDSVTVNVRVTGSARQPRIELSSSPPLDQGDILSLILFNQPVNALGQSDRTVLADRAAAMAAGALTQPLAGAVAEALDVDLFEIRPAGDSSAGPSVALGRQIGSNLFVRVQQTLADAQDSQLLIEYQFSKFLRLVTSVAQGTQTATLTRRVERSGIDLVFVIRFR